LLLYEGASVDHIPNLGNERTRIGTVGACAYTMEDVLRLSLRLRLDECKKFVCVVPFCLEYTISAV
jgi:hypothetical protein